MKENKNIEQQLDSLFREKLNSAEVPAPEGVWEAIAQNMAPAASPQTELVSNTGSNIFSGISTLGKVAILAAASAVTGFGIYYTSSQKKSENQEVPAIESTTPDTETLSEPGQEKIVSLPETTTEPTQESTQQELPITNKQTSTKSVSKNTSPDSANKQNANPPAPTNNNRESEKNKNTNPTGGNTFTDNNNNIVQSAWTSPKILTDTVVCFSPTFNPSWCFGNQKTTEITFYSDNKTVGQNNPEHFRNQWLTAKAKLTTGTEVQRRVRISNPTLSIEFANAGKDAVYCELLNAASFSQIVWYINNQLFDGGIKHIVYYRNMEIATGTPIYLKLLATDQNGCADSLLEDISPYMEVISEPMIPNVITPNNDGLNDNWIIEIEGEIFFHAKIIDANNTVIFQSNDKNIHWNGLDRNSSPAPAGSYIYIIEYQFPNENLKTKTGLIQLIRN